MLIHSSGSACLMWLDDFLDTKQLSEADSITSVYVRVSVSELDFNTGLEEDKEKEKKRPTKFIILSIASVVFVSAIINGGVLYIARRKKQVKGNNEDLELPLLKMVTIVQATNNFSMGNMIGVGDFGPVYKGSMPSGEEIGVKRLSRSSQQGLEEFSNEVIVIVKLQRRSLVGLLGCCIEEKERMLIYE